MPQIVWPFAIASGDVDLRRVYDRLAPLCQHGTPEKNDRKITAAFPHTQLSAFFSFNGLA
ncbi:UNVERIFIED_ORG: hypothetical protein BCL66_1195 [Martelella mediterranea]